MVSMRWRESAVDTSARRARAYTRRMRTLIAASVLLFGIVSCGTTNGGSGPVGAPTAAPTVAPAATAQAQPADATKGPSPSKSMDDDPYGYGY